MSRQKMPGLMLALGVFLGGAWLQAADEPLLTLKKGDHISILGNTLAERMQHHGWLETLLHARFPEHQLVVRNLGFPGDELTTRLRSAGFGSPEDWLTKNETDVVLAFFGYNESFAGKEGLDAFKADLREFIANTLKQQFNGESAPRLVLFSPIAHENLENPHMPDGKADNERLATYTQAMKEVAQEAKVPFVDLFTPSLEAYKASEAALTDNGIHPNLAGDQAIARIIEKALLGETTENLARLEALREAVNDKNSYWFHRYRTTDGYSIYGGRADLKFTDGQTNRVVMDREMLVLDEMTANRDKRVWALANGKDLVVDDSNTSPFIPVISNKPGEGPNGEHLFLSGEEALAKMEVHPELQVNLFASEEQFPDLISPVQIAFDTKGRLWVATWPTYPHWKPKEPMNDKLLILEDTDNDGQADRSKVFAGDLHNPTGFEFWGGGVIVAMAPDLLFLKDTDGDDVADVRVKLVSGIDSADTHHTSNSFVLDPGGALYFQEGTFHHSQIESPWGPPVRLANAGMFRLEPRTGKIEAFVSHPFANPHGHVVDRWGQGIVHDGTGAQPYHTTLFSGRIAFPAKHDRPPQVYQQRTRPCSGTEILSSRHFPEKMQGNMLVGNVIGFQGILQYRVTDQGASFVAEEVEPILSSTDPNFRPTDFEVAPDGSLYFGDWQNPIIGHMQHNLRDPNRDRAHGRIYRVTAKDRPLLTPPAVAGQPIDALLALLKSPEDRVRSRARIELTARETAQVMAALPGWLDKISDTDPDREHQRLEGLWLHQSHDVVNIELLDQMLASPDWRARAAAVRVLCYWRDRVPGALERFKIAAADAYPRVRLEAIRAASYLDEPEAIEIVAIESAQPTDLYLDYTRKETLKTLDPIWKSALADGRDIAVTTPAGERFILGNMSLEALLKRDRSEAVCAELLARPDVRDEVRREVLDTLAGLRKQTSLRLLLDTIAGIDNQPSSDETVLFDLVRMLSSFPPAELATVRPDIEKLATKAKLPLLRQVGYVALVNLDGSAEKAWELGKKSTNALYDLVRAVPLIPDASLRASFYDRVEPLLRELPESLAAKASEKDGQVGRYVRIELPRRGTLTLAEVEVFSDGRNIARGGQANQKNTSNDGKAARAIDGNTSSNYSSGSLTHTIENTENPWWELDLGGPSQVDRIVVYNRGDGRLGARLEGFTLSLLDENRQVVYQQQDQPAPATKAAFSLEGPVAASRIRHAAMDALPTIRGQETAVFKSLASFVKQDDDRVNAIRALQRLPRNFWAAEEAPALLDALIAEVKAIPVAERTSQPALDTLEFADALTSLLPLDQARPLRAQLRELGVRVIKLGTLLERMAYDKDTLAIAAGKPVEFVFENNDLMPHNFVITVPGSLEEIGLLGEATAQSSDAASRQYVPVSDKILLSSRLLQPRDLERLSFQAPTQPGVYPYVCTYPGHWRRMYGALYVVEDLDSYLADPVAYLASNPLPIRDTLLKERRPRTEWTLADLGPAIAGLEPGRSYGNGKQMFTVASCVSCHRVGNEGKAFGPDLVDLDPKWTATDILQNVLEPSASINEKYKSYIFELDSGLIIQGLIVEETPEVVKIVENPLASTEPKVIEKREIIDRAASPTSLMPKGLLDNLTRDEVLDLISYLAAKGDQKHALYQGAPAGHDHGSGHKH